VSGDTPRTDAACNSAADWGEVIELARQLEHELAAANQRIADLESRGIHTCHDQCTRPLCVANRELAAAKAEIAALTEYADKLAEGLPEGMLPKDVKVIRDANAQLADELAAAKAENERLCKINDSDSMTFERGMARIVAERDHERERAERCEQSSADLASATAHRACCGTEHDPINGRLHGYCVVCGVPWPCETASYFLRRAAVEVEGAR
jgi:hypothetical protein